jgi:hypothetical protein
MASTAMSLLTELVDYVDLNQRSFFSKLHRTWKLRTRQIARSWNLLTAAHSLGRRYCLQPDFLEVRAMDLVNAP